MENYSLVQLVSRKTWQQNHDYAVAQGGRLPTLSEGRNIVKHGALQTGKDSWIAVGTSSSKDWMQIGDTHHYPGKSHVLETGGFPSWDGNLA